MTKRLQKHPKLGQLALYINIIITHMDRAQGLLYPLLLTSHNHDQLLGTELLGFTTHGFSDGWWLDKSEYGS